MFQSQVIGNLGADAAFEKDNNSKQYAYFSIAHKEFGKDSSGQFTERTVWLQVKWYGYTEKMFACLKKGTKVFVSGRTSIKAYIDKNNNPQPGLILYASEVELCGMKNDNKDE